MWMKDCDQCSIAKLGGLQVWMQHLTDEHAIPTEWPSDRATRLTGSNALRPYTTIAESKKKRRKDSIPRPLNSFMLFAQHIRRNVLRVFSDASNSVISQQLGDLWRTVPRSCRNQYDDEANRLVKIHQIEFPNYKYQPKKRQITSSSSSSAAAAAAAATSTTTATTTANTSRSSNDHIRMFNSNSNHLHNPTHTHTQSSISMNHIREDQSITSNKLLSTHLLKTNTDYNVVYSSSSSPSSSSNGTNKLSILSNRHCSIPGTSSSSSSMNSSVIRKQLTNVQDVNSQQHNGSNEFMNSPSKVVCNTIYTKLEPKPLSVNIINTTNATTTTTTTTTTNGVTTNNSNNTTNSSQTLSFKPTIHSLSSVLPPLLNLSSNHHPHPHHHHQTTGLMNEQYSFSICDSAYASGINSSSSSSASSPAVGELISPAKSYSSTFSSLSSSTVNIKQNKHSPIRRKIHFIPIRPQSQQLLPVGNQPTRQRFLSANNGTTTTTTTGTGTAAVGASTNPNHSHLSTIGSSCLQMNGLQFKSNSENLVLLPRMTNDLHAEQREELMNETIVLQDNNNHEMLTTDVLTPVYIQLDHEGHSPPTEGLMLTLPPGTTLIQTNNDHIHRSIPSKRFYITNGNRIIPAISKSVQILQPLKVMNVIHHHHHHNPNHSSSSTSSSSSSSAATAAAAVAYPDPILYSPIMSSSELLSSSSSYSCNSSPNSIVSPLSGDVFLPMQQVELMPNSYEQQSSCMDIYQFDEQNQLDMCIEEEVGGEGGEGEYMIDERKMTHIHAKNLDTITNIISIDECMDSVNNDSGILHNWSSNGSIIEKSITSSSSSSLPLTAATTTTTTITMGHNDDDDHEHGDCIGASNRHLPLTIDIMKSTNENLITLSSTSSSTITTLNPPLSHHHQHHLHHSNISIDNDLTDTDFSITNDNDNFDSSFDAMMNSIDITTFLPGTFQTNEEQDQSIHNDYNDVQLNSYNHQTNNDHHHEFMKMDEFDGSCHHIINDVMTTTTAVTTTPTATSSSSFMNKSTNSQVYNVVKSDIDYNSHHHQHYLGNTMNMNHENRTVRIISPLQKVAKQSSSLTYSHPTSSSSSSSLQGTQCSTSLLSSSSSSSSSSVLRMNSLHELLNNSPQICSSSTLADLDSLDKSSLFIIKPEWSVLA
uniref:HMG box domain-containing protein n=1 Tax=Schistosoma mansoni TaxID=6183 RepID=A0A3Q0KPM3_SCHMA